MEDQRVHVIYGNVKIWCLSGDTGNNNNNNSPDEGPVQSKYVTYLREHKLYEDVRYMALSNQKGIDLASNLVPMVLFRALDAKYKITQELWCCDGGSIALAYPGLCDIERTYGPGTPYWNEQFVPGPKADYWKDWESECPNHFIISIPGAYFGRFALPKDHIHSPVFHAMKLLSLLRAAERKKKKISGWIVFSAASTGIDHENATPVHNLITLGFPWSLLAEFVTELVIASDIELDCLSLRKIVDGEVDITAEVEQALDKEGEYGVVRQQQVTVAFPQLWCGHFTSMDAGMERTEEVCFIHNGTPHSDLPMMDMEDAAEKIFLLNAPNKDIRYPNQMMKSLLGFSSDEQSSVVGNANPMYKDCTWPCRMNPYTWYWSPATSDLEMTIGVNDEERGSREEWPVGVRAIEISQETAKLVLVEHYNRDVTKRQSAESIIADLEAKCPNMYKEAIELRKNTAMVRISNDVQSFANFVKINFGYHILKYDTAQRVKTVQTYSEPSVLLKGPRDTPPVLSGH